MKLFWFVFLGLTLFTSAQSKGDEQKTIETKLIDLQQQNQKNFRNVSDLYMDLSLDNEERGRLCLKNLEQCYHEDHDYEIIAKRLLKLFFTSSSPPFDFNGIDGVSQECKQQNQHYINDLQNFKLWALKMYDSSAKLSSGILNGNVNQFGDFDMCLQTINRENNIKGQYCLATIQIQSFPTPYLAALQRLAQSHYLIKNRIDEVIGFAPSFSDIYWALCVPDACTLNDIQIAIYAKLQKFFEDTDVRFDVRIKPQLCHNQHKEQIHISTFIAIGVFATLAFIVIVATIYDYKTIGDKNKWIIAFSLRKNLNYLLSQQSSPNDIHAIHGIRFLNSFMLLITHKAIIVCLLPAINRTERVEDMSSPMVVFLRAGNLYTDIVLMISATLAAYSLFGKLQRSKKIDIIEEYRARLMRIIPAFVALIAFTTLILPWLNNGPLWNMTISQNSQICKQYWWRNLLFIHNYFGYRNLCCIHTHHIGIDTQLFFVSPILVLILWKWPKKGGLFLLSVAIITTIMRYYVTYTLKLSVFMYFGAPSHKLFESVDNIYILPHFRITVYIMGIFLGYILTKYKNYTLSQIQIYTGNTVAFFCFVVPFWKSSIMGTIDYKYDPFDAAWYEAFAPILFCLSFAWIIFTTHLGYKGVIGRVLSQPIFLIWSKISYSIYLVQIPIFLYYIGTTRTAQHFTIFTALLNFNEVISIILSAYILTLLIELPFQNLRNLTIKNKQMNKIKSN